jgi:glycogen debranching enzyme
VLGMQLRFKGDEVIVWFNRRIEPVVARLPMGRWAVGIQSDPGEPIALTEGTATLPPRSVVALVRAG